MRPIQRRLRRAHFEHLHIGLLLPPIQMSKERKTSSTAIRITLTFASQPDPTSHLTDLWLCILSVFLKKLPPVQILQLALPCISRYSLKTSHFNLAYNSWWTMAWKKRDPEVLLNFSKYSRKELGWEIHIKDITQETNVQRDSVIDISLGILAYWKGGLRVYWDKIWTWMLLNLDAFRNSLGLSW